MDICFPDDVSLSSRVLLQFYSTLHHTEPFIDFSLLATVMIVEDVLRVKREFLNQSGIALSVISEPAPSYPDSPGDRSAE